MNSVMETLAMTMERYFRGDTRRIDHARQVTACAEQLREREGGDETIVIGAAILHDIGIPEAERKHGSAGGKYQEMEGPPIARRMLQDRRFKPDQIKEICEIIAHHHSPGRINTLNFKILYDADWLVNLKDEYNIRDRGKLTAIIDRVFLTESGRDIARDIYLRE